MLNLEWKILNKVAFIAFLFGIQSLIAQPYSSDKGAFRVNIKEGCAPLTVQVELSGFNCTCIYSVSGGGSGVMIGGGDAPFVRFNYPGTYILKGTAQTGSNPYEDQITITVNADTQPDFEISSCNGNKVSIKVTTTQFDSYIVDFDNNLVDDATILSGGTQSATFAYGSSGAKTITVRGKDNNALDNCSKKTQSFTAIPSLTAAVINTLAVNDAASIGLTYTPSANYQYKAQIATNNATTFQPFQTINTTTAAPQALSLNGLATDNNYYCFRINAFDPCANSSVNSNTICSADFDVAAASDVNHLTWATAATGVLNYTIKRDAANLQTLNATTFDDTNVTCNTDYNYQLLTHYSNGSTSTSLTKTVTAFSSVVPPRIDDGSAVVNQNTVDLSWVQPTGFPSSNFTVFRNENGGAFASIGTSTVNPYIDDPYSTEAKYCYQITYVDACNNTSPQSATLCPIRLTGLLNAQNQIQLDWSAFEGWKNGVKRYRIEKFDASGTRIKTINSLALTYSDLAEDPDNQIVSYRIIAEPNNVSLEESISNTIIIKRPARLVFPTAFTPNQDNLNDKFSVSGFYVENMSLQIFDRWGTLLFSTNNNEPWDGTHNGRLMPESTYIWKAFITDKAGEKLSQTGSVALLHKPK